MPKKKLAYYPRYPRDFREDERVAAMNKLEKLAYLLLLDAVFIYGGSHPDDPAILATATENTPEEWAAVAPKVLICFTKKRGRLYQKRMTRELSAIKKRSRAAKKSINNRWKMEGGTRRGAKGSLACVSDSYGPSYYERNTNHNHNHNHKETAQSPRPALDLRRDMRPLLTSSLNQTSPPVEPKVKTDATRISDQDQEPEIAAWADRFLAECAREASGDGQ